MPSANKFPCQDPAHISAKRKERSAKNPEEAKRKDREAARKWREKNKEKWNAYQREQYKKNPGAYVKYRKDYFEKNPEHVLKLRKASNLRRKDKIQKTNKEWYEKNKKSVIARGVQYEKDRKKRDPGYRSERLLRNLIVEVIKYQGAIKSAKTKELIGCDRQALVGWIESKFKDGMTWSNHGVNGWHIDHVRPCSTFDLSDPDQQRECFNYKNLQPMWGIENREKSNKWTFQST